MNEAERQSQDWRLLRFWSRVREVVPKSNVNCWEWTGIIGTDGYGIAKVDGLSIGAHRLSWTMNRGDIPTGLCVLHRCDNPTCVRPSHLFLGTKSDNSRDALAKGRLNIPARNRGKTHCKRGHEFTIANTAVNPKNGERRCRECTRMRGAATRKGEVLK